MGEVRIAPTTDRRVVGVMNEFAFQGEWLFKEGQNDLEALWLRMSSLIIGKLDEGPPIAHWRPSWAAEPLAKVIAFPGEPSAPAPSPRGPVTGDVFRLKVTLLDTKPPIWRRVLVDGSSTLDHVHEVIQVALGWWNCHLHEFAVGRPIPTRTGANHRVRRQRPQRPARRVRRRGVAAAVRARGSRPG